MNFAFSCMKKKFCSSPNCFKQLKIEGLGIFFTFPNSYLISQKHLTRWQKRFGPVIIYFQANVRIDGNKATCNVIWLERGLNTICILQQQRKKLCEKGAGIVEKKKRRETMHFGSKAFLKLNLQFHSQTSQWSMIHESIKKLNILIFALNHHLTISLFEQYSSKQALAL